MARREQKDLKDSRHGTLRWLARAQDATPDDGISYGYGLVDGWMVSHPGEARMLRLGFTGSLSIAIPFGVTIAAVSFCLRERPILRANARRRQRVAAAQTLRQAATE